MTKKPKVFFVCIGNSCRSQMAEGFARKYGGGDFEIFSAGSKPLGRVNPIAIEVMKEIGIDISKQRSKGLKDLPIKDFDYVVGMGCGEVCPFFPGSKTEDWKIDDPIGTDMHFFRKQRDLIGAKVKELLENIRKEVTKTCSMKN